MDKKKEQKISEIELPREKMGHSPPKPSPVVQGYESPRPREGRAMQRWEAKPVWPPAIKRSHDTGLNNSEGVGEPSENKLL